MRLRDAAGAGASALNFGGLWNAMIVVQVVLAVLVLPPAIVALSALGEPGYVEPGFPGEEYLSARMALELDPAAADSAARAEFFSTFRAAYEELELAGPGPSPALGPGGQRGGATAGTWAMPTSIDTDFFEAFGAELIAGRGFTSADLRPEARVVVVNEHFVEGLLGGRSTPGGDGRLRNTGTSSPAHRAKRGHQGGGMRLLYQRTTSPAPASARLPKSSIAL